MPFPYHSVEAPDGSQFSWSDRIIAGYQNGVANASGETNATVTTAVSFGYGLPSTYAVFTECDQPAFVSVTNKTFAGFDVILTPPSGGSIAAGTFNVLVIG